MGHHHHFHLGHVFHEVEHVVVSGVEHYAEHEVLNFAEHEAAGVIGAIL